MGIAIGQGGKPTCLPAQLNQAIRTKSPREKTASSPVTLEDPTRKVQRTGISYQSV